MEVRKIDFGLGFTPRKTPIAELTRMGELVDCTAEYERRSDIKGRLYVMAPTMAHMEEVRQQFGELWDGSTQQMAVYLTHLVSQEFAQIVAAKGQLDRDVATLDLESVKAPFHRERASLLITSDEDGVALILGFEEDLNGLLHLTQGAPVLGALN